jgi:hypothetical protein
LPVVAQRAFRHLKQLMWFRNRSKNKRFERDHVLDVKLRSNQARAVRLRFCATLLSIVFGAAASSLIVWKGGEWALDEFVYRNPAFTIDQIDITTDGIIPVAQLKAWGDVREGENLLAVDLMRVQRDLQLMPWIEHASVERVLPNILKIRVLEREPIAQVLGVQVRAGGNDLEPSVLFLDRQGYVIPSRPPFPGGEAAAPDALPTISGLVWKELQPGRRVEAQMVHSALRLIGAFRRSPMLGIDDLNVIDVSSPQVLRITSWTGSEITVRPDAFDSQLRRWRSIYDYALAEQRAIGTLDLSVTNNIPARWQEASLLPPERPKPAKPSRYKKNHV